MNRFVPSQRDRWLALGVLGLAVGLLAFALYTPLLRPLIQAELRLADLRAEAERAQRVLLDSPTLPSDLRLARARLVDTGRFLVESSEPLAQAALAQRLQEASSSSSTEQSVCLMGNRVPVVASRQTASCMQVGMDIELTCGIEAFDRLLLDLERSKPRLRIEELAIGVAPNPLGFDRPSDGAPLKIKLRVAGCRLPPALAQL